MLRAESEEGWWLITHPDHAELAAAFAEHWGNAEFAPLQPRMNVLHGIRVHDDGWSERDEHPQITREGKPSAFSHELVGKYSAFEEIDVADYLAVRDSALRKIERECAYAALLVSMHTYNLLTVHADRSTIATDKLPLLDAFLEQQLEKQEMLRVRIKTADYFGVSNVEDEAILNNFHLLQAMDNLSLFSCVGFMLAGDLLHALPTRDGGSTMVAVLPLGLRKFRLTPYPFDAPQLEFTVPARHVEGRLFTSSEELAAKFAEAPVQKLTITISA